MHEETRTIEERVFYPDRDGPRKDSALFDRNKSRLRKEHPGCYACGSKENPEIHHWFEWALWPGLDPDKVVHVLEQLDFYGHAAGLIGTPIKSPDDIRNLVVLCQDCHRGKYHGLHMITAAIWFARLAAKAGVTIASVEQPEIMDFPLIAGAPTI